MKKLIFFCFNIFIYILYQVNCVYRQEAHTIFDKFTLTDLVNKF